MTHHEILARTSPRPGVLLSELPTRRGVATRAVERIIAALSLFIELLYAPDDDGRLCNVDAATGKILAPTPWGSANYKRYNLQRTDADIIRKKLSSDATSPFALRNNRWHLNLRDYPDAAAAKAWLFSSGWTLRAYRALHAEVRKERRGKT